VIGPTFKNIVKRIPALAGIFFILFFSSCKNSVYSEYKSIPEKEGWRQANKITFEVDIKDTESRHNVFVNIRQADGYPFKNLFLFLTTEYPGGKKKTDTLECILADDRNRWIGEGAGDLWDNTILFKQNVVFPVQGKYKFTFEQAMRVDPLPMIMDVGLSIEKAD
jgi:gliding motility-associated lipoprotein GldH